MSAKTKGKPPGSATENHSPKVNNSEQILIDVGPNSAEPSPPPLPPRRLLNERPNDTLQITKRASRPQLLSRPTIALSPADVHAVGQQDRVPSTSTQTHHTLSRTNSAIWRGSTQSRPPSDAGETSSVQSYAVSIGPSAPNAGNRHVGAESLLEDFPELHHGYSPAWKALDAHAESKRAYGLAIPPEAQDFDSRFYHEFDPLEEPKPDNENQDIILRDWKSKLKHFLIISSSGKPIWSRHGGDNDQLISGYVGVIQTLISFYQDADDQLIGFTAGDTRFVVVSKGHLQLLAITRLCESDAQLRTQLDSLYMQILSTLTLPSMERMFVHRPSTDLRKPLQGTESLLDALADGFMRGSPSTLLSSVECLRLRKTQRRQINNSFLKVRSPSLLYGLIAASGRLISVMRPRKLSLHPGDLHLIFNMLFEAGGVKAGGGENWIPLCLPGFNKTGFVYMYVSFMDPAATSMPSKIPNKDPPFLDAEPEGSTQATDRNDQIAITLISADREAFFELRQMRNDLVAQLLANKSMGAIDTAIRRGRPAVSDITRHKTATDTEPVLRHFLYNSRGNVQFVMPSYAPHYETLIARRRLLDLYHVLHNAMHTKTAHLQVQHVLGREAVGLVWETPLFELYAVAGPTATKQQLALGANKVIEWVRREEERVFIIGGAVF